MVVTASPVAGTLCPAIGCSYTWSAATSCGNGATITLPKGVAGSFMVLAVGTAPGPGIDVAAVPVGQDAACTLTASITDAFGTTSAAAAVTVKVGWLMMLPYASGTRCLVCIASPLTDPTTPRNVNLLLVC